MISNVILPKQGLMMEQGTITRWLIAEGEEVKQSDPLFEMETDKLTISIDAPVSGRLLKILHKEGETVPVATVIAYIGEKGDQIPENQSPSSQPMPSDIPAPEMKENNTHSSHGKASVAASPRARMKAEERGISLESIQGSGPDCSITEKDVLNAPDLHASPLAKQIAARENIDLNKVSGTGPHGKILRSDVERLICQDDETQTECDELIPLTGMRKIIAARMLESQTMNASAFHCMSVDMTQAAELRESYKRAGKHISYNDIVLFAVVKALQAVPMMNASFTEDGILRKKAINIGMAVAVPNGLLVPNIKHAERLSLQELSEKAHEAAKKAQSGALLPEDCAGGTFTVSNLGMYGLDFFYPIINSPEAGILGVGAIKKTPVVVDDSIAVRPIMTLTLTYDHRLADGALAAEFISTVCNFLRDPYLML